MGSKIPPVRVGETIKLGVVGFGKKGNPMFKLKGYTIFLEKFEGVAIVLNQMIPIRITKAFENFGFAVLEDK